jgi:hypothetical protein
MKRMGYCRLEAIGLNHKIREERSRKEELRYQRISTKVSFPSPAWKSKCNPYFASTCSVDEEYCSKCGFRPWIPQTHLRRLCSHWTCTVSRLSPNTEDILGCGGIFGWFVRAYGTLDLRFECAKSAPLPLFDTLVRRSASCGKSFMGSYNVNLNTFMISL